MGKVNRILNRIDGNDPSATEDLLPLVYEELRRLAAARLANEKPGQSLQATALVHEAFLRLVDQVNPPQWDGRGHFFAAAAEAMRRILVERARRRKSEKHGGQLDRIEFSDVEKIGRSDLSEILSLNEAIDGLASDEREAAELVKLRIFAGFSVEEAGKLLGMSRATAYRHWTYARAWLKDAMSEDEQGLKKK